MELKAMGWTDEQIEVFFKTMETTKPSQATMPSPPIPVLPGQPTAASSTYQHQPTPQPLYTQQTTQPMTFIRGIDGNFYEQATTSPAEGQIPIYSSFSQGERTQGQKMG